MAVLGLRFCARAFSSCGKRGPLFIAVRGPLIIAGLGLFLKAQSICIVERTVWRGWATVDAGKPVTTPTLLMGYTQ